VQYFVSCWKIFLRGTARGIILSRAYTYAHLCTQVAYAAAI